MAGASLTEVDDFETGKRLPGPAKMTDRVREMTRLRIVIRGREAMKPGFRRFQGPGQALCCQGQMPIVMSGAGRRCQCGEVADRRFESASRQLSHRMALGVLAPGGGEHKEAGELSGRPTKRVIDWSRLDDVSHNAFVAHVVRR